MAPDNTQIERPAVVPLRNVLTIDVEDYFHVTGFEPRIRKESWRFFQSDAPRLVEVILSLLEQRGARATFFFLGWVARQHPELVQRVHAAGHDVGCHGYWHRQVFTLTPDQFRRDLADSRKLLEDLSGERVCSYRAPSFSIAPRSAWAFETLCEQGFTIDSSIQPRSSWRTRSADVPLEPYRIRTKSGTLTEYPLPVYRVGRLSLPIGGGGYFRLLPYPVTRLLLQRLNANGRRFISYIHPWEFDPEQMRFFVKPTRYFRHYFNLASLSAKYARMLDEFAFTSLRAVHEELTGTPSVAPVAELDLVA